MQLSALRGTLLGVAALFVGSGLASACSSDSTGATADDDGGSEGAAVPDDEGGTPSDSGSPGTCGPTVKPGFLDGQKIKVGTDDRTYAIFVPDTYDATKSFPMVFVFHGDGGNGAGIRKSIKLEEQAAGEAIFVYPDGEGKTWHFDSAGELLVDVAFVDALAASLGKTHCTDNKRLFAVGFSRGAYFSNLLGCIAKTPFRAVVAHAGGGPFGYDGTGTKFDAMGRLVCPLSPTPAALQVIGDADGLLGDAKKARDHWQRVNACKTSSKPFAPSPCVAYDDCAAGRPEIYCEIPGLGHAVWSSAAKVTWDFLRSK